MKIYTVTQEQLNETPAEDHRWRWPGVDGPGEYTYSEADNVYMRRQVAQDFDRGFGIGGLGHYEEPPVIPTVAQIERLERLEARSTVCRRCGQSDAFDGAMFTTGGGDVCDDCY